MMTTETTRSYYFDPLTQTHSTIKPKTPSVHVKLTSSLELPVKMLTETIQQLGNYTALRSVKNISQMTQKNYCTNYAKHAPTCAQAPGRLCNRHLTSQELDECTRMEELLEPIYIKDLITEMDGLPISYGELDQMRNILDCVRSYVSNHSVDIRSRASVAKGIKI